MIAAGIAMPSLGTSYSLPPLPMEAGNQRDKVISLLEKKKKKRRKDGLYKYVLWKEALRDVKTKMDSCGLLVEATVS